MTSVPGLPSNWGIRGDPLNRYCSRILSLRDAGLLAQNASPWRRRCGYREPSMNYLLLIEIENRRDAILDERTIRLAVPPANVILHLDRFELDELLGRKMH